MVCGLHTYIQYTHNTCSGEWLDVPVTVKIPDQVLPVHFRIVAQLTTARLIFTQPSLVPPAPASAPAIGASASASTAVVAVSAASASAASQSVASHPLPTQQLPSHLRLDFGRVLITQSAAIAVTITNPAPILQQLVRVASSSSSSSSSSWIVCVICFITCGVCGLSSASFVCCVCAGVHSFAS